jgi:SAM-dependent methyltransferase
MTNGVTEAASEPEGSIFATPWDVRNADDCFFYTTMDIPGHGLVKGHWDLRANRDEYLGKYGFAGKRVLEIGPASGFLTFEVEKLGASVVAVEVRDDLPWDIVPYSGSLPADAHEYRREQIRLLKNSFWFAHRMHGSRAKVWYGDAYNIPNELGKFDVAILSAVLLHVKSPLLLMAECAKRASALIITDLHHDDLEGKPICRLVPSAENHSWETWWNFSSDFIRQFASVLGYRNIITSYHEQDYAIANAKGQFFTVVANL